MTRKKKPTTELVKARRNVSAVVLDDNGNMKEGIELTADDINYYKKVASSLNELDINTVSSYGSELQNAMSAYKSDFLNQQMESTTSEESAKLIANLLGELKEVDIDELKAPTPLKRFLRRIPFLKGFVTSVEKLKAKYNTIQKNIDGIVDKLEATKQIAIRDNNLLQKQFENNCEYIDQLGDLIIAGKMKSKEIADEIHEMEDLVGISVNDYEVTDMKDFKEELDKRITDLIMLRYVFKQSLAQIRIIQRTNIMDANTAESQLKMVIPLWKDQLSTSIALHNQKNSLDIHGKVADTTNNILKKNSEMMKMQAVEAAKQSQRSILDIETLKKTTEDLLQTIENVKKAQAEGRAKRAEAEATILSLEKQMEQTATQISKESQRLIVSKELKEARKLEFAESVAS